MQSLLKKIYKQLPSSWQVFFRQTQPYLFLTGRDIYAKLLAETSIYSKHIYYEEFIKVLNQLDLTARKKNQEILLFNREWRVPDAASFLWQFKEIFLDENYKFASENQVSPIIYDCGANNGLSCLYFKKMFKNAKVYAFEADPEIAKICQENLFKSGFADVQVVAKAVWLDESGVQFRADGADGGSIMGTKGHPIRVPSFSLKKVLTTQTKVDILKMDIEGAEVPVLIDCADELSKVQNLFVEYHSWVGQPQKLEDVLSILAKNGFRYFIKQVSDRPQPFLNRGQELNMDAQLNIFAYRI